MLDQPDPSIISVGTFELSEPFRLTVLTEVGSNPQLTALIAQGWRELQGHLAPAVTLDIAWVGATPEDVSRLNGTGFPHVYGRRDSAGRTWNDGLSHLRSTDPDALILCEANGVFDVALVSRYVELLLDGYEGVALFDLYLADARTGRAVHWRGHTGERKGWWLFSGACFSRSWLNQLDWTLWPEDARELEAALTARVDRLASSARTAGEHRVCGVQGWQMHPLILREEAPEGFFEQSGEGADAQPRVLTDLLTYFGTGAFATGLYRFLSDQPASVLAQATEHDAELSVGASPIQQAESSAASEALEELLAEGERAFAAGDLERARSLFARGAASAPGHAELLNNLGVVRHAQGAPDEAESLFLKALFLNEDALDPVVSLIHMAQGEGRHRDALLYVLAALRRRHDDQFVQYAKASLLLSEDPDLNARVEAAIAGTEEG